MTKLAIAVATWFGCGYSPKAPGTVGSAAAVLIGVALVDFAGFGRWHLVALAVLSFAPFVWAADVTARELKLKDPQIVVADEVIGQWVALAAVRQFHWAWYLAAFALFRVFDIWKPPPVRQFERLPGGLGIVADDVMAGGYAALVLLLAGCFNRY